MKKQMLCIAIGFTVLMSSVSVAEEHLTIVTDVWPPYVRKEQREVTGISTEVVKKAMAKTNISYELQVLPWARAYDQAKTQPNTLIFTLARTLEREDSFQWIHRIHPPDPTHLYMLKNSSHALYSFTDALHHTVAVLRDSMASQRLQTMGFEVGKNLLEVSSSKQAYILLQNQHVKFFAASQNNATEIEASFTKKQKPIKPALFLMKSDLYIAGSKSLSPEILSTLKKAFSSVVENQ
jgi:polar amino acid transport system substrate-binding protein